MTEHLNELWDSDPNSHLLMHSDAHPHTESRNTSFLIQGMKQEFLLWRLRGKEQTLSEVYKKVKTKKWFSRRVHVDTQINSLRHNESRLSTGGKVIGGLLGRVRGAWPILTRALEIDASFWLCCRWPSDTKKELGGKRERERELLSLRPAEPGLDRTKNQRV